MSIALLGLVQETIDPNHSLNSYKHSNKRALNAISSFGQKMSGEFYIVGF